MVLLILSYIYYDPFRVLYKYSNYYKNCFCSLNRDFVSTEVYLNNKDKLKYDCFIFGSSKSLAFLCTDWKKYIPKGSPFHYDASNETLTGLRDKINFINEENGKIDHAIIVIDMYLLGGIGYLSGPLYEPHPLVSKTSWFNFHTSYFKSFLSDFYLVKFLDYYYTKNYSPYMKGIVETRPIDYNAITNDFYLKVYDEELEKNPEGYIKKHIEAYTARDTVNMTFSPLVINEKQISLLSDIYKVLSKQHTKYKIVIPPPYNQEYLNKKDLEKLDSIFGKENVYDFSGKNEYSRNIENYYESFHFRPKVARDIMRRIYSN